MSELTTYVPFLEEENPEITKYRDTMNELADQLAVALRIPAHLLKPPAKKDLPTLRFTLYNPTKNQILRRVLTPTELERSVFPFVWHRDRMEEKMRAEVGNESGWDFTFELMDAEPETRDDIHN